MRCRPQNSVGVGLTLCLLIIQGTVASVAALTHVGPADAWCGVINQAVPGEEIVLRPGAYTTPCWLTARGTPEAPIVVRSQSKDPAQRAVFAYPGASANVLELRDAAYLVLRELTFAPTREGVDAIRIWRAHNIIIEHNLFQGIGGIAISANTKDSTQIVVRQNTFRELRATGLYFGCHDGTSCRVTDLLIEGNRIDGVSPSDRRAVGYGIQIKLNSWGVVRHNAIYRTKGPGIMIYGSNQHATPSTVEHNHVAGSLSEGGVVIGGGPAVVRHNVLLGNAYGGISVQNYGRRNLLHNIWLMYNTILDNDDSGINVASWQPDHGNIIAFNAIAPKPGTLAIRPPTLSGTIIGNIVCTTEEQRALCRQRAGHMPADAFPTH